jgi:hypothetical protein
MIQVEVFYKDFTKGHSKKAHVSASHIIPEENVTNLCSWALSLLERAKTKEGLCEKLN